jgi:hypothetical protein
MSSLEVRSPVPPTRSTSDLVQQVLAHVRSGNPEDIPEPTSGLQSEALKARAAAAPPSLADLAARTPPGPTARPAPAPLKGPPAAQPPRAAQPAAAAARPAAGSPAQPPPSAQSPQGAAQPAPFNVSSLIDEDAPWLPPEPERKTAFLQVFRYWHSQVRPENAAKATPAFLFLVSALPVMVKARDDLKALNLWEPPGEHSRQARDQHSAWKKYCEFLPRAQQALQELDAYRHLSLLTGLDDLNARITKAEKRFREGVAPVRPMTRR